MNRIDMTQPGYWPTFISHQQGPFGIIRFVLHLFRCGALYCLAACAKVCDLPKWVVILTVGVMP